MKIEVSHFGVALTSGLLVKHIQEVKESEWSEKSIMTKEWYLAQVQEHLDALNEASDKQTATTNKRFNR